MTSRDGSEDFIPSCTHGDAVGDGLCRTRAASALLPATPLDRLGWQHHDMFQGAAVVPASRPHKRLMDLLSGQPLSK